MYIKMFHFFAFFGIQKLGVLYAEVLDTSNEFKIFFDYDVILRWHPAFEDYDVIFYKKPRFLGNGLWLKAQIVSKRRGRVDFPSAFHTLFAFISYQLIIDEKPNFNHFHMFSTFCLQCN